MKTPAGVHSGSCIPLVLPSNCCTIAYMWPSDKQSGKCSALVFYGVTFPLIATIAPRELIRTLIRKIYPGLRFQFFGGQSQLKAFCALQSPASAHETCSCNHKSTLVCLYCIVSEIKENETSKYIPWRKTCTALKKHTVKCKKNTYNNTVNLG